MQGLKVFLGVSIPIAIVLLIISAFNNWNTVGMISLGYAILAGIFWAFAKHF
ncbi:MAG TPA: hypothetical protein VJJ21_03870 [Candidatus Nanoarchaeia archaeon]|nr:hypothetical protein [Candidatus Nanoarchaeia archaeon]